MVNRYSKPDIEMFEAMIRFDPSFAARLNFFIDEKLLSFYERCQIQIDRLDGMYSSAKETFIKSAIDEVKLEIMDRNNIPTILTKVTYNNETIEIYE